MNRFLSLLTLFLICSGSILSQTGYSKHRINGKKLHTFEPGQAQPGFNAQLRNLEAPSPDGDSYRSFLMQQKIKSRKLYPIKSAERENTKKKTAAQPTVGQGFTLTRKLPNGNVIEYVGGIPNDNALAVSNGGIVLAGINSVIWAYDSKGDSILFPNDVIALSTIAKGALTERFYDPKLIYDEKSDRFILVFLKDNLPSTSRIVVCFSKTNNPLDGWNVYTLPGNPLDNNRWTDFPAINITNDELFITGNLIVPGVSWQIGFDGSVIWQINKNAGYNNDTVLPSNLYAQVKFDGKFTRNIHPVRGIGSSTTAQYFLSNRNFDITNDTIFVMKIDGTMDDPNTELKVTMAKTSPNYGVPPNGRQQDTDLNDPTKGLQTNDARVLGAITNEDWIQYVSTTVNPATGLAAIYHGTVLRPTEDDQSISGTIYGSDSLDYGYPNIAFTGNEFCDIEAIVGMLYTSPTDFPGVAAFYYGNDSSYSDFIQIKEGENYTDRHSDSYERWGDYFGIQPKFDEPGKVWTAGYYGNSINRNVTWLNELSGPDSSKISVVATEIAGNAGVFCKGEVELQASGGVPPYFYSFNGSSASENSVADSICDGDTLNYSVTDARGCIYTGQVVTTKIVSSSGPAAYPNPFSTDMVVQFELEADSDVEAYVYDVKGSMVAKIIDQPGKAGTNELYFNLQPLKAGVYVLRVLANDNEVLSRKLIKND